MAVDAERTAALLADLRAAGEDAFACGAVVAGAGRLKVSAGAA